MTRPIMHGVGLLRVSRSSTTVDSEQYVVFVKGWIAPESFGSWIEAYRYFRKNEGLAKIRKPRRLCTAAKSESAEAMA